MNNMNNNIKRTLAALTASIVCFSTAAASTVNAAYFSALPTAAEIRGDLIDYGYIGNFYWTLDDTRTLTITGAGELPGFPNDDQPWNTSYITKAVLSSGITGIGEAFFRGADSLTSVSMPSTLTSIGSAAFNGCTGLTSLSIPNTVTTIGSGAFYGCTGITEMNLPTSLEAIPDYAFYGSGIKNIFLQDSVKKIGNHAFENCASLEWVAILADDCEIYDSKRTICNDTSYNYNGIIYGYSGSAAETYANKYSRTFTPISGYDITGTCGENLTWKLSSEGTLTISGTGNMNDYTSTTSAPAPWSKYSDKITSVVIEDGVTSIGDNAFCQCSNITSVTIPDSVTSIGLAAFSSCTRLAYMTIPESVTNIGGNAFEGTEWLNIKRNENSLVIVNDILVDGETCTGSVEIPDSVKMIAAYAFSYATNIESITIPDSVTSIGFCAFGHCTSLTSVTIPASVTSIEGAAFYYCPSLTSITILNPDCEIADEERTIEYGTIRGYSGSTAETYANKYNRTFESIGDAADARIIGSGTCGENLTWTLTNDGTLTISGTGTMTNWTAPEAAPWYQYKDQIKYVVPEEGVESFGNNAFRGYADVESIGMPSTLKRIGEYALAGTLFIKIELPLSVSEVGTGALSDSSDLFEVVFYNESCNIADSALTVDERAVIKGYAGSTAETYANKYSRVFVPITDEGDITAEYFEKMEAGQFTSYTTEAEITEITVADKNVVNTYLGTDKKSINIVAVGGGYTDIYVTLADGNKYAVRVNVTGAKITTTTTTAPVTTTTTTAETTTTTTTAVGSNTITVHIGETISVPGIEADSTGNFRIDGDKVTGLKVYKQLVMVNNQPKYLSVVPPEAELYADGRKIRSGGTIVYKEGMKIRAELSNFYPDLENNATWNIAEARIVNGSTKYSTSSWRNLYDSSSHIVSYDTEAHTAVIEFTLNSAPANDLSGVLYWHIANGNEIAFSENAFTLSLTAPEVVYGDANEDGEVKLNDAVLIMQALANPNKFGVTGTDTLHITEDGWTNADCNNPGDGVTGKDALAIQKLTLQLIDSLPEK